MRIQLKADYRSELHLPSKKMAVFKTKDNTISMSRKKMNVKIPHSIFIFINLSDFFIFEYFL